MEKHQTDDPYKVLGLDRDAAEAEIKQAYFSLVREHSPEHDPEGFKRIRAAYEKLRSTSDRAETDLFTIDEHQARLDAPPPVAAPGIEQIKKDLFALEALLLIEELKGQ